MSQNIIPSDAPVTLDVIKSLTTLQQQAIVRPDNPPPGLGGFLFDIDLNEIVELQSEITDYFVENNTSVQDHIALKPETVTLHGLIAELRTKDSPLKPYVPPPNPLPVNAPMMPVDTPGSISLQARTVFNNTVRAATSAALNGGNIGSAARNAARATVSNTIASARYNAKLAVQGAIRSLLTPENIVALSAPGALPQSAQVAVNALRQLTPGTAQQVIESIRTIGTAPSQQLLTKPGFITAGAAPETTSLYNTYQDRQPTQPGNTNQTSAFLYFYNLWRSRQLFSVETPWGIWNNMAILNVRATQEEDTKYMSDFIITFKKVRAAENVVVSLGQVAGRNVGQLTADQPAGSVIAVTPVAPEREKSILKNYAP